MCMYVCVYRGSRDGGRHDEGDVDLCIRLDMIYYFMQHSQSIYNAL